ncbi:MAG TPA: hypothetical protein VGR28_12410, partial [Candidatus Thermoplasmatota archaeon]|nr:hypothetical protein [Candidatus Thermoplasmatota archaeon]
YLWEEVFSDLGAEDRTFLSRISVLHGPVDLALAAAVAQEERARERFYALERRHLCVPVGEAFVIHDVVRQFAAKLGKVGPETHARAARALLQRGDLSDALEAMGHFLEAGQPREALALVRRELDDPSYRFVDMGLAAAYDAVLQRLAPALDLEERAAVLLERAHCQITIGPSRDALALLDEADRAAPKAAARLKLRRFFLEAEARYRANEPALSAKLYTRVMELAERSGDARVVADALLGRANAQEDQGKFALAVRDYTRALAVSRAEGDSRRVALLEAGLARTMIHTARRGEALRHLQAGLEAAQAFDDVRAEANLRRAMTEFWLFQRDYDKAWDAAENYLAASQRLGDPWGVCCALTDSAWIAVHRRRFPDAERLAREVMRIHRRTPLPFFEEQAEAMMVLCAGATGRWAEFEAAARALSPTAAGMQWFYGTVYINDLERALEELLTPADLPMAQRMLKQRGLAPWVREPLERFARAQAKRRRLPATIPEHAPPRRQAAVRSARRR